MSYGAITVKSNVKNVWQEIYSPGKRVVAQIAPAVRVAIGEEFGLAPGTNSIGKVYTAMRMLGFDIVFDTSFAADLTIMEESAELVKKLEKGDNKYPLFTSCCPAWVRFAETKHPEILPLCIFCRGSSYPPPEA